MVVTPFHAPSIIVVGMGVRSTGSCFMFQCWQGKQVMLPPLFLSSADEVTGESSNTPTPTVSAVLCH